MNHNNLSEWLIMVGALMSPVVPSWEIPVVSFFIRIKWFSIVPLILCTIWSIGIALLFVGAFLAGKTIKRSLYTFKV
ncbi:MAG: hypothetical protein HY929_00385 [Euryarchaeota archaeon]|nr:hypothetical protein [Euryarchaeota archaeon]